MRFLLPGLIAASISFLCIQWEKCEREGRPFFSLGRAHQRKQRGRRVNRAVHNPGIKDGASDYSMQQLNVLTRDSATTQRLIQGVKTRHPNRSLEWCAQRAIWEIERDRK